MKRTTLIIFGGAALVAAGAAWQIKVVNLNKLAMKRLVDESNPIPIQSKLNTRVLASQKFIEAMSGAFIATTEFNKPIEIGDFVFESTAAVVTRTERSRSGNQSGVLKINAALKTPYGVVSTGQRTQDPWDHSMEFRVFPLNADAKHVAVPIPLPENPDKFPKFLAETGTDNQIVRAKDGSLLAFRNTTYWGPPPGVKPNWWDKHSIQGRPNGARVGTMVWKSTDGANWKQISFIDPMSVSSGRYAIPRPAPQESGCPDGCFGGFDRMEAYACPFTGAVYATMNSTGGWRYDYSKKPPTSADSKPAATHYLFKSIDGGSSWKMVAEFGAWTPIVITSTPSGRVYIYSNMDKEPMMAYSTSNSISSFALSAWYNVGIKDLPVGADELYGDRVYKACNTITRISGDSNSNMVRISYPITDSKGRSAVAIANVSTPSGDAQPTVTAHGIIKGGADRSVLCSAFVDGDPVAGPASQVAAFFWIEGTGTKGKADGEAVVKCRVYRGEKEVSNDVTLSGKHSPNISVGHYMGGGAFSEGGKAKFLLQWPELESQKAQVVSVPIK